MRKRLVAECNGYKLSVYEEEGNWFVEPIVKPDGWREETMGGPLTAPLPLHTNKPFPTLAEAKEAACRQFEQLFDPPVGGPPCANAEWTEIAE